MFTPGSKADQAMKLLVMGAGSYFVWYFAGPLSGEIGRHLFEYYYYMLHGTPSHLSFEYWINYLPLRGHATNYFYKYGEMGCVALSAPVFYLLPDLVRFCVTSQKPVDAHDREMLEEELESLEKLGQLLHVVPQVGVNAEESAHPPILLSDAAKANEPCANDEVHTVDPENRATRSMLN